MCNCKNLYNYFSSQYQVTLKLNIDVFQVDTQFRTFEPNEGPIQHCVC